MDVKAAVALAKQHVLELFADERIVNLGLEEVEFDEPNNTWHVTLGFSRPWDEPRNTFAIMAGRESFPKRSFKIVRIHDPSQKVVSVKSREVAA